MNDFGHADFGKINLKMILNIFDGPNSGQKNANQFFLSLTVARHISGIFWAVNLAPKSPEKSKKQIKRSAFDIAGSPGSGFQASVPDHEGRPEGPGAPAGLSQPGRQETGKPANLHARLHRCPASQILVRGELNLCVCRNAAFQARVS